MKLVGRILKKKLEQRKNKKQEKKTRIDRDLPLDLRVGSKVKLPTGSWVLYMDQILMEKPVKEGYVLSFGKTELEGNTYFRFYIGEADETQAILQIGMDGDQVGECRVFTPFAEIVPQTEQEWEEWIEVDGLLGQNDLQNDEAGVSYDRIWGDDKEPWVQPPFYVEAISCGPFEGDPVVEIANNGMLFGRWLEEDVFAEYLMAEFQEQEDEAAINIMIGYDVPYQSVKIEF